MEGSNLPVCKICILSYSDHPRNLYDPNYKALLDLLYQLLGFQIQIDNNLLHFCGTCEGKLVWVREFQDICQKSLEKFKTSSQCKKESDESTEDICLSNFVGSPENSDSESDRPLVLYKKRKKDIKKSVKSRKRAKIEELQFEKKNTRLSSRKYSQNENYDCKNDENKEIDTVHNHQNYDKRQEQVDLSNIFSENDDSDYVPQRSDCDSDYEAGEAKPRPKKVPKNYKKPRRALEQQQGDYSALKKPNASKQFPEDEVLIAITESTSYFTNVKNRSCIHCDFEASTAKLLSVHMKYKHRKQSKNWCYRCNQQTNNLEIHKDSVKCNQHRCKFCNKLFLKANRLTTHLRTHSHKAFTELYKDVEDDVRRLKQFPAEEVSQAIAEYESYMTDMKNRTCIYCDFVAPISTTLRLHMTMKHEESFEKWCKHCNLQTDDLQKHGEITKCHEQQCKFCKKIFGNIRYFVQHLRTHCKTQLKIKLEKIKEGLPIDDPKLKPRKQFPPNEVLQAIAECTNFVTDRKYRSCIHCDFEGPKIKALLLHMRFGHKDIFETWCSRCNVQTENLKQHVATIKCCDERCNLCCKIFPTIKRLTRHLKSHCRQVFKKPGEDDLDFDWEDDLLPQLEENALESGNTAESDETGQDVKSSDPCIKTDPSSNVNVISKAGLNNKEDQLKNESGSDSDEDLGNTGGRKRTTYGPLKQFPQKQVYRAITDAMKCFFTNRKCIVCGYLTLNSKCLGTHMSSHKDVKDKWCSLCNALVGELSKHWENHKNDLLKCTFCERGTDSTECLKDHLRRHCRTFNFDPKQKWFVCKVCPNSFPEEQQLKTHECKGYDPKKVNGAALCAICNKRVHNLRVHMRQKHNPNTHAKSTEKSESTKKKLCPICGKTFMVSYLPAHMCSHTGEMPYKCSYCDKGFALMSILRSHEKRHTGEKPFVCHICGKGFVTGSEHRSHMQIHEGGPVQCSICKKEFNRPGVLKLHMRRHTGENQFSCLHCGISYHRRSLLINHMRTHSNERPFKCSFCEKDFRDSRTLQQHENIHKGIKPYNCSMCSFSCTQSHALTSHMKQHPEDAPQADRPYKCLYCYRAFSTNAMLMSHTNHNHRENVTYAVD